MSPVIKNIEDFELVFTELDELIKQGSVGLARQKILEIPTQQVPRKFAYRLADLSRRVSMAKHVTILLGKYVRPTELTEVKPSDLEVALYALALSRLGAFSEAEELFKLLGKSQEPEIWLFRALHCINSWDTDSAVPHLQKYLKFETGSSYSRIVAKVNLSTCLLDTGKIEDCQSQINEIWNDMGEQKQNQFSLLYANTLEILSQSHFRAGQIEKACEFIKQALVILNGSKSRYEFYSKKWKVIFELFRSNVSSEAKQAVENIMTEAKTLRDMETVRECLIFRALAEKDMQLLTHVYYGSSHKAYRRRIERLSGKTFNIEPSYLWNLETDSHEISLRCFNLLTGHEENAKHELGSQQLLLQLFRILCQDFFRPIEFGFLISQLYPDEYYNPETTPRKAFQIVTRLRTWFVENDIPLNIEIADEMVKIVATKPYSIRLALNYTKKVKTLNQIEDYREQVGDRPFTVAEASEALSVSKSTGLRMIKAAIKDRILEAKSAGKGAKYRFLQRSEKKSS